VRWLDIALHFVLRTRIMQKLAFLPLLLILGCVIAGFYGMLHNQISYTVSPEYFQEFKFEQFAIPLEFHNRIGAAIVGCLASWWMGLIIGIPLLLIGLIVPGWKAYVSRCLIAILNVVVTTLAVGLIALLIAYLTISPELLEVFPIPNTVIDKIAFARAGAMHDAGYLGGLLGILTGATYLFIERARIKRRMIASTPPSR
jgi:hypothetical protein